MVISQNAWAGSRIRPGVMRRDPRLPARPQVTTATTPEPCKASAGTAATSGNASANEAFTSGSVMCRSTNSMKSVTATPTAMPTP